MSTPSNPHALKQFIIALVIVLTGVFFGSKLALKKADEDLRNRPPSPTPSPARKQITAKTAPPDSVNPQIGRSANDFSWTNGMVWIPPGTFIMGSTNGQQDEVPPHAVEISGFWMDKFEVTNQRYQDFATATGFETLSEKQPRAEDFPGVPPDKLIPGSIVFAAPGIEVPLNNHYVWWKYENYASWRRPEGKNSSISDRMDHPVVHVSWHDASAYCKWIDKRLPTEAEWEYAARGGSKNLAYTWGDEKQPEGKWLCNTFQGDFPNNNTMADGFNATAPVGKFPPNAFGLHDMAGNVWEWCQDWYMPNYYAKSPAKDPQGPNESYDPNEPGVMKKVNRGGSFLCNDSYCAGYRPTMRMKTATDTGLSHTGFRCVKSGPSPAEIAKILAARAAPKS